MVAAEELDQALVFDFGRSSQVSGELGLPVAAGSNIGVRGDNFVAWFMCHKLVPQGQSLALMRHKTRYGD
jgi:hypothetical protein